MSKTISDEHIKLRIIIDGDPAQKELFDLEKATRKLKEENNQLLLKKKELEKQGKKDTVEYTNLTRVITANSAAIEINKNKMFELQRELGLTSLTIQQLRSKAIQLRAVLGNLTPGSADYEKYNVQLKAVQNRLSELSGKAQTTKLSLSGIADTFNRYQGLALSFVAGLTGVVFSIQKIIDINGKLSESQADVMKTTGMNKKEVDELTKSFGLLETRTSRIDLLKIAEQGGRLGIPKAEIQDFVKTMNMAAVSLGDSFTGGVDEVAEKLGKIKFLFKETKDMNVEQAYQSIGSAINELGANGTANEANIAEFTKRIGSLTDVLKPSVQETLALGTAFEESGIEAETSARAYNIFMKQASTESGKFAKVMGISQKAVEGMINTNPLDFMLNFSKGLKGMDATQVAKTLDYLGVNADGANKVVGAMGNNFERFHELIDLSNNSFASGSSLINEYNVKNENLAATLEKIGKRISAAFSSEGFIRWLTDATNWFAEFIGAVESSDKEVSKFKIGLAFTAKTIAVLIASLISYNAWILATSLSTKNAAVANAWFNLQVKAQLLGNSLAVAGLTIYTGVMNFFGISTNKATAALTRLNLATKLSPWGAVLAVITAVTVAYLAFSDSTKKAVAVQETFARQQRQLNKDVAKSTLDIKSALSSLVGLIKDENVTNETKIKAYKELIRISPVFNGYLKDEKINVEGLLIVYNDYLKALDQVAYARQFNKLNDANLKKQITAQQELFNAEVKLQQERKKRDNSAGALASDKAHLEDYVKDAEAAVTLAKENLKNADLLVKETNKFRASEIQNLEKNIALREKQLKQLEQKYGVEVAQKSSGYKQVSMKLEADRRALEAIIGKQNDPTKSTYNVPGAEGDKTKEKTVKSLEELNRLRLESEEKYLAELLKLKRQGEDDAFAIMNDSYIKEMTLENLRYKREIEDLMKQKVHKEQIAIQDEEMAKAKKNGDIGAYNFHSKLKSDWIERNKVLDAEINKLSEGKLELHKIKSATIEEKWAKESFAKVAEQYNREKNLRETNYNEQLAAVGNNKEARKAITDKYEKEELATQKEFLLKLLKEQQDILAGKNGQVDLTILSPEQKQVYIDALNETLKKLSELGIKIEEINAKKFDILQGTGTDVFGMSPEQWQTAFDNLGKLGDSTLSVKDKMIAVAAAAETLFGGMQNAFSMYSQFAEANQQKELRALDKKQSAERAKLKRLLDNKVISQTIYDRQIKALDTKKEKEQAEMEYKKAKRDRIASVFQIVTNTGIGIMKSVAEFPQTLGMPWSGIIAGMGALQTELVLKTPLPAKGYEKGLYPIKREQDGKMFNAEFGGQTKSGLVNKPTYFLTGENGPEMIIDSRAYSQISPATKNALLRELQGIKGWENGKYNQEAQRFEVPAATAPQADNTSVMLMMSSIIQENTAVMKDLKESGVMGYFSDKDWQSLNKLRTGLKTIEDIKTKAKK